MAAAGSDSWAAEAARTLRGPSAPFAGRLLAYLEEAGVRKPYYGNCKGFEDDPNVIYLIWPDHVMHLDTDLIDIKVKDSLLRRVVPQNEDMFPKLVKLLQHDPTTAGWSYRIAAAIQGPLQDYVRQLLLYLEFNGVPEPHVCKNVHSDEDLLVDMTSKDDVYLQWRGKLFYLNSEDKEMDFTDSERKLCILPLDTSSFHKIQLELCTLLEIIDF
jgi:hypothetical protein